LIAAGTSAAAALSTPPAAEEDEVEDAEVDELALLVVPDVDGLPGLLPLPQPAVVRASAIPAAPTMKALEVLQARMCSPPGG